MSGDVFDKCKAITWSTTMLGSIGIGVFEDKFGKRTIRICQVVGSDIKRDIRIVDSIGATLPESELERLLSAYKEK